MRKTFDAPVRHLKNGGHTIIVSDKRTPKWATYRLFFLLHPRRHLWNGPVDGREVSKVWDVLGMVDGKGLGSVHRPRSEQDLAHGGDKGFKNAPKNHLLRAVDFVLSPSTYRTVIPSYERWAAIAIGASAGVE